MNNRFGWIPDTPDARDFLYKKYFKVMRKLPSIVDMRDRCSTVENQGSLGSCTAQAVIGAMECQDITQMDYSRLFVYYNTRKEQGTIWYDSGGALRTTIKVAADQGSCDEILWPYKTCKFRRKPSKKAYEDALNHQIISYERMDTLAEMKSCLADGYPFVFGFSVYTSFENVGEDGLVPMPGPNESLLGGHAVMAVGYNEEQQRFIVRNSWGVGWGDKGYCYMPYAYLENRDLSDDFWSVRSIE